jgi:hypothetical protein
MWGTALHAGKDLFVAPFQLPGGSPFAYARGDFSLSGKIVSVVTSILADDGRYPLPISPLPKQAGACSDFPPCHKGRAIV